MKLKVAQIKKSLARLLWIIAEHAFLTCLLLFLLALIFGGFLFYIYNILAQKAELEVLQHPFLFKEKTYQEVLEAWQENEKRFEQAGSKEYLNPFEKPFLSPEEEIPEEELTP